MPPQLKHAQSAKGAALQKAVLSSAEDFFVSESHKFMYHLVQHWIVENSMSAIIIFNFVLIIVETDSYAEHGKSPGWMEPAGIGVLLVFVVELCARVYVERRGFWNDHFNCFDCTIVVVDAVFSTMSLIFGNSFPVSILRVFRLCKIARVSKVFRVFPELRLMMAGMIGAMSAIFWGALLMVLALLIWSIVAVQFIHPLNKQLEEQGVYGDCERCGRAFQDVMSSCLTFSQQIVAGDSWGQVSIPIIEHFPVSVVFFIALYLTVGMAILNLMLAVCVDVATQARQCLKVEMEEEQLLSREELSSHLINICRSMDADDSGELTKTELIDGFDNSPDFRQCLKDLEIGREDLEIVWIILDTDKSGLVSYTEFIAQLLRMKNSDSQFMLAYIKFYVTVIRDKMSEQMGDLSQQMDNEISIQKKIQENVELELGAIKEESKKIDLILQSTKAGELDTSTACSPINGSYGFEARLEKVPEPPMVPFRSREEKLTQSDTSRLELILQEARVRHAEVLANLRLITDQFNMDGCATLDPVPRRNVSNLCVGICSEATLGSRKQVLHRDQLLSVPGMPRQNGAYS